MPWRAASLAEQCVVMQSACVGRERTRARCAGHRGRGSQLVVRLVELSPGAWGWRVARVGYRKENLQGQREKQTGIQLTRDGLRRTRSSPSGGNGQTCARRQRRGAAFSHGKPFPAIRGRPRHPTRVSLSLPSGGRATATPNPAIPHQARRGSAR